MLMAAKRWRWLAVGASLFVGPVTFAAQTDAHRADQARAPEGPPVVLGVMADAGVPDGANAALALRPAKWLRLYFGGGHNTVSTGLRGGVTALPLGAGPSLSVEVGHYRDGDANGLIRGLVGSNRWLTPLFER